MEKYSLIAFIILSFLILEISAECGDFKYCGNCMDSDCNWCLTSNICFNKTDVNIKCQQVCYNFGDCPELRCFLEEITFNQYLCLPNHMYALISMLLLFIYCSIFYIYQKNIKMLKPWRVDLVRSENHARCYICCNDLGIKNVESKNGLLIERICRHCHSYKYANNVSFYSGVACFIAFLFLYFGLYTNSFSYSPIPLFFSSIGLCSLIVYSIYLCARKSAHLPSAKRMEGLLSNQENQIHLARKLLSNHQIKLLKHNLLPEEKLEFVDECYTRSFAGRLKKFSTLISFLLSLCLIVVPAVLFLFFITFSWNIFTFLAVLFLFPSFYLLLSVYFNYHNSLSYVITNQRIIILCESKKLILLF